MMLCLFLAVLLSVCSLAACASQVDQVPDGDDVSPSHPHYVAMLQTSITVENSSPGNVSVPFVLGTHHKTGTVLMANFLVCLGVKLTWKCPGEWLNAGQHNHTDPGCLAHHWPDAIFTGFVVADKVVHIIRDPAAQIVSAYNYNKRTTERWIYLPIGVGFKQRLADNLNVTVVGYENYQQLLNRLPEELGLQVETLHGPFGPGGEIARGRDKCEQMGEACLELCLESFTASSKSFNSTMARMLRFLDLGDVAQAPDVQRCITAQDTHSDTFCGERHVASESQADQERMKEVVRAADADGSLQSSQFACEA